MFQFLDSEYKTATRETLRKQDTESQRQPDREDLSKMTRHEEGKTDRRLASGMGFQLEDRSVPVSGAVSRGHTIMFRVFQEGRKKRLAMFSP